MKRTTYKEPKFYLDGKNEIKSIFLKYSYAPGFRLNYYTGIRIAPEKWDKAKQRVKRGVLGAVELNDLLNAIAEVAAKEVRIARLAGKTLTPEELKRRINDTIHKSNNDIDFIALMDKFIQTESLNKSWSISTRKKVITLKQRLIEFGNPTDIEGFIKYLQNTRGLVNSTVQAYINLLRWFFQWCVRNRYISEAHIPETVKTIKLKQSQNRVIYLTLEEIKAIHNLENLPEPLLQARDIFIFQCLTGLRFSDLYNLKAVNIFNDTIHVTTIKTTEVVEIELNDTTREILNRYREFQGYTGRALPVPVNVIYNERLKELARLADITEPITLVYYVGSERTEQTFEKWQLVSSHTARRSFITNSLAMGITSEVIRSWTGHRTDKAFAQYYEIVKQRKLQDIQKLSL